jgi:hypothetical protein
VPEPQNDGNLRISGRYGELFIVRRPLVIPGSDERIPGPPVGVKLMEAENIEATAEKTFVDVNLPGTGDVGSKDGPTNRNGTLTVQHITTEWQQFVKRTAFSGTLSERRRARDLGQRLDRTLVLQIWNDDPSALGAEGWQVEGVDFGRLTMGFSQDDALTRELPFRFRDETEIRGFQRIGSQLDPVRPAGHRVHRRRARALAPPAAGPGPGEPSPASRRLRAPATPDHEEALMPPGEDDDDRTPPTGPQADRARRRRPRPEPRDAGRRARLLHGRRAAARPRHADPARGGLRRARRTRTSSAACSARSPTRNSSSARNSRTVKNSEGIVERIDPFTRWSYVFAYACREPDLAQALEARRAKGEEHPDTASVVREVFRFQPGVLKNAAFVIEDRSRHADDKERTVREIEAGKGSS